MLPRFYDSGECRGRPYFVCELLEPVDEPRNVRAVAKYLIDVCNAVGVLHGLGLVHRDLKPSNVMRRANGELVLIDLGLVKNLSKGADPEQDVSVVSERIVAVGTPSFAAPEQLQGGTISPLVDIHAIGRIANSLLGEKASRGWTDVIRRATSSIPGLRYHSAGEMAAAIRRLDRRGRALPAVLFAIGISVSLAAIGIYMKPEPVAVRYVDGESGDDANPGTGGSAAKKTIQAAIDCVPDGGLVLVGPGTYAPIATHNRPITIRSTAGRETTVIDGENRRRCADLGSEPWETNTVVEGFSIVRGHVKRENGAGVRGGRLRKCLIAECENEFDIFSSLGGGAWRTRAEDCEFRNNRATHGGGLADGTAVRCVIRGNIAQDDGGGAHTSTLRDCQLVANESRNWGGGGSGAACAACTNFNVTIVGNVASRGGGIVSGPSLLRACIIRDNKPQGDPIYRSPGHEVTLELVSFDDASQAPAENN